MKRRIFWKKSAKPRDRSPPFGRPFRRVQPGPAEWKPENRAAIAQSRTLEACLVAGLCCAGGRCCSASIRLRPRQERPSDGNLLFRRGRDRAVFSLFRVRNPTEPQAAQKAWLSVFARACLQFDEAMSLVMTDRMKKNQSDTMPAKMRLFCRERLDFCH